MRRRGSIRVIFIIKAEAADEDWRRVKALKTEETSTEDCSSITH